MKIRRRRVESGLDPQRTARLQLRDQLGLEDRQVSFLLYHGNNDDRHLARLEEVVGSGLIDEALADRIVKTAKVTARLYLLQLEEIDNT